jgi:hypothetical protein
MMSLTESGRGSEAKLQRFKPFRQRHIFLLVRLSMLIRLTHTLRTELTRSLPRGWSLSAGQRAVLRRRWSVQRIAIGPGVIVTRSTSATLG